MPEQTLPNPDVGEQEGVGDLFTVGIDRGGQNAVFFPLRPAQTVIRHGIEIDLQNHIVGFAEVVDLLHLCHILRSEFNAA